MQSIFKELIGKFMKNIFRLIYIAILLLSAPMCFAGETEEEVELNSKVLVPITKYFSESSSLSRLVSLGMIEAQKKDGQIKNATEAELKHTQILNEVIGNLDAKRLKEIAETKDVCKKYLTNAIIGNSTDSYAAFLSNSWAHKAATCDFYTRMVITAFAFNEMNDKILKTKLKQPLLFKKIAMIQTAPGTGDHMFVIVEGNSGTMFAVDPWIHKVVKLNDFTKLSSMPDKELYEINLSDANQLNALFGHEYKSKIYYDEYFVGKNTKWLLNRKFNKHAEDFVYNYDNRPHSKVNPLKDNFLTMKDIYNYLRHNFPGWQLEYDELFAANIKSKDEEYKRPETSKGGKA